MVRYTINGPMIKYEKDRFNRMYFIYFRDRFCAIRKSSFTARYANIFP